MKRGVSAITVYELQELIGQYGIFVMAALVFMEYLGVPGYPGGVSLPLAGVLVHLGVFPFLWGFLVCLGAAVVAFTITYSVCAVWNGPIERFFAKKPKRMARFQQAQSFIDRYGNKGIFLCRMLPVVRAIISIPAGLFKMNFVSYLFYSVTSTAIYVAGTMGVGYLLMQLFM